MPSVGSLKVNLRGDEQVQAIMRTAPDILRDLMTAEVTDQTLALLDRVRTKASGSAIGVDKGKLLASIRPTIRVSKGAVRGKVRSSGVKYFGVVNFGGRLPARVIKAKKARALHMVATSGELFAAVVNHPAYNVGRHEIMYSSLDEIRPAADAALRQTVEVAVEKVKGR